MFTRWGLRRWFRGVKSGEPTRVTLDEMALLLDMARGLFEAGVAANKIEMPTVQPMLSPSQRDEVQQRMQDDAAWIITGGEEPRDGSPPEVDE